MESIEIKHLKYCHALSEELNFSKAAKRVSIAQPHLSREIKNLEQKLGYKIFERTSRKVAMTQQGAMFVRRARRILEDMKIAVAAPKHVNKPIDILYNEIPIPVNVYDEFGWLIGSNEAWINFWKIDDLVPARTFNILQDKQIPAPARDRLTKVFQQKTCAMVENIYFDPAMSGQGGIPRHFSVALFPMLSNQLALKHYVAIHIDKTETLQLRGDLVKMREENTQLKSALRKTMRKKTH